MQVFDTVPCRYCGLPTQRPSDEREPNDAIFCCFGCRIADGIMSANADETSENQGILTRLGLSIFFTMNVMVFTLALWTWNLEDVVPDARTASFREILRYACLLFASPVVVLLSEPLLVSCHDAWRQRRITTDVLLLFGVCAAFSYSVLSLWQGWSDVYFEVACMILVAVTLGKWLEATAKHKAGQKMRSLQSLLPQTARRIDGARESNVSLDEVKVGDTLRILAGERIPVDGVVDSASCVVDEQIINGESIPNEKVRGDSVFGGSLNLGGELYLRSTSSADSGAIAQLVRAVNDAAAAGCVAIRQADRMAAWLVPFIALTACFAFFSHNAVGFQNGLMAALSVVLIACPCALGIATPLALWMAINVAARHGALIRNGDVLVTLAKVRSMAFDKTGTVTTGNLEVCSRSYSTPEVAALADTIAHRISETSQHVMATAIRKSLSSGKLQPGVDLDDSKEFAGRGVTCEIQLDSGRSLAAFGSARFCEQMSLKLPSHLRKLIENHGSYAVVCVGWNRCVHAVYLLADELRPEAVDVLKRLESLGLKLAILTGDREERATAIANLTGLPTVGELSPHQKHMHLQNLPPLRAMVGDGVNDAVALAQSDVGISLDCGADVSRDAADLCLLGDSLKTLPWVVELARATRKTIRLNLVWATAYNLVGIGFAMTGQLNPIVAAIAMVGSSFFVLTNSTRLMYLTPTFGADPARSTTDRQSYRMQPVAMETVT